MSYPNPGDKIKWTNAPKRCIERGDEYGTFQSRDGDYLYCKMYGTGSVMELYPNEIKILEDHQW